MNDLIKKILIEWSFRLDDGMINLQNPKHIIMLSEILKDMDLPEKVIVEVIKNITTKKSDVVKTKLNEVKGDTSDTTFYHEVITGIIVGGGKGPFKTGEDVGKFFKNGTIVAAKGSGAKPVKNLKDKAYVDPRGVSFFDKSKNINPGVVSDAIALGNSIVKNLGKARKPVLWTGPTNDKSIYGAGDIGGKFTGYGDVGVSLKKGKGQLKNLTVNTFFQALGLPNVNSKYFLDSYREHWDAMCKDWVNLVEKTFNGKIKGDKKQEAKKIFSKHKKETWDGFQKETITKDELEVLNTALGMNIKKTKFRDFCRKIYEDYGMEWNSLRDKHFDNIFKEFSDEYDDDIRKGLHNLFKRQLSVGKTSLFYAAKAGKVFWFIPSEKLYDKTLPEGEFIADYETRGSGSGYSFILHIGTQETGVVGSITIMFRWKQGQMNGFPDTTSDYKLNKADWSDLLGAFRK